MENRRDELPIDTYSDRSAEASSTRRERRSPGPEDRQRDSERTRELLLQAALLEFSAKGFAGARVQDIADRAGVNKQLVSYYFDGKAGLYRAIRERWLATESNVAPPNLALDALVASYARAVLTEPDMARILVWMGLEGMTPFGEAAGGLSSDDVADLQHRQEQGELAADLDPLSVALMTVGATVAPVLFPDVIREVTGLEPDSPEFSERYEEQLRKIMRRLAGQPQ